MNHLFLNIIVTLTKLLVVSLFIRPLIQKLDIGMLNSFSFRYIHICLQNG